MKKWIVIWVLVMSFSAALAACGGESAPAAAQTSGSGAARSETSASQAASGNGSALSADYRDALAVDKQLAFGTMQLEDTDLAVTADQAQTLLPYWRVLRSLNQTGSAAQVEIDAVVKQIEGDMTGEQIAAIAAMELTEEKLQTMFEEGTINFGVGRGFGQGERGDGTTGGGFRGGPGGGFPGGPPGGGAGGGPGGLGGDPGAFATRQAEMEASGQNPIQLMIDRISTDIVIRLLETKTGEAPAGGFGSIGTAFNVLRDMTGLNEEEFNAAIAEGQTLEQVLEAHGVTLDEAKDALLTELAGVQLPNDQDLESWIDSLLSGTFGARPGAAPANE